MPPALFRVLNIIGYAGWAAIIVGLVEYLFRDPVRGMELMLGGVGAIAVKYPGTLVLVLLSRSRGARRIR